MLFAVLFLKSEMTLIWHYSNGNMKTDVNMNLCLLVHTLITYIFANLPASTYIMKTQKKVHLKFFTALSYH